MLQSDHRFIQKIMEFLSKERNDLGFKMQGKF